MIEYTDITTNETGIIELWKKDECQKFTPNEFLDFLNKTISENVFAANMIDILVHIITESLTARIKEDNEVYDSLETVMCENERFTYSDVWGWNIDGFLNTMNGLDR